MIKLFLSFNSDVNFQNDYGITPMMQAVATRREDIIMLLLEKGGIDYTLKDYKGFGVCDYFDFFEMEEIKREISECRKN